MPLTHVMNKSVLEILQYPITQWETKPFHDISDALWITCDNPSAKTDLDFQQFQVVLSPSEDYAVLFYKVISKVEILQGEIRSMVSDVYGRVPIMIDQRVQAPEGSSWGLNYREVTELDYSDNRSFSSTLFTADGFDEEHKGKIVIRDGKEIIVQPKKMPTSTSGPDIPLDPSMVNPAVTRPMWPWWRYLATVSGLILVVVGIAQLWKKNHSRS